MSVEEEEEKKTKKKTKVKAQHFLQLREAGDLVLSVWLLAWERQRSTAGCARETESWGVESGEYGDPCFFCCFFWLGVGIPQSLQYFLREQRIGMDDGEGWRILQSYVFYYPL